MAGGGVALIGMTLGENLIPIQRGLTTSSTAIFIPFITQELFQTGAALYYGLNALSNNMILCDRKQLKNPNGLILGTPGSGKSFAAKREMTNAFLITDDDIIICDPEAEYFSLVQRLNGQVIRLSPTGKGIDGKPQYVNPMDINLNYSEDDSPLALKSDFILSLCELVIGGKEGLQPIDKTVIDRAVRNVYRPFLADPDPANMPILGDLYDELLRQPEPEAARIASALELYVSGSLNVFNHRTNVELSNRLVCFDIKQLGKQLKKLGINRTRSGGYYDEALIPTMRNKRDVWLINTVPYSGGHFAAYPPKLAETCILAGCPKGGVVIDPFLGSGTTAAVAKSLDRHYIGIELNIEYCALARARIGGVQP